MKFPGKKDLSRIGFVNKISGFKGNLSCITDITHPEKLLKKKFLFILLEGLPVPFAVVDMDIRGSELIVKFEDVDSEAQAKRLLRKEIYIEKFSGKKKDAVISWKDLVDYSVIDSQYGELGIIKEVFEYPMQMIARCVVEGKEILFPLNDEIVTDIDDERKKVFIDLPEGLLDVYLK